MVTGGSLPQRGRVRSYLERHGVSCQAEGAATDRARTQTYRMAMRGNQHGHRRRIANHPINAMFATLNATPATNAGA